MSKITMLFGALLCGVSLLGLLIAGKVSSPTIFIPMFVGVPLFLLGLFSELKPTLRKHLMHVAVTLGLLGALAALGRGIPQLIKMAGGAEVDPLPLASVWTMILLCSTYVVLCVQSFIQARRARELAASQGESTEKS
jgi:hypothetical protein